MSRLNPVLHDGTYVFTSVPIDTDVSGLDVVATMQESEGLTLVLPEAQAKGRDFSYKFRFSWITIGVQSALDSVGLTTSFSKALSERSIAVNVVAGVFHDHLFVPRDHAEAALECLRELKVSTDT